MKSRGPRLAAFLCAAALAAWAGSVVSRFAAAGPSCFDLSYAEPGEGLLHAAHPSSVDVSYRLPFGMIFEAAGVFHCGPALVRAACWLLAGGTLLMAALLGWLLGGLWQALAAAALWLGVFDSLPKYAGFFKQMLLTFQVCAFACALALPAVPQLLASWAAACGLGATFLTRSTLVFLPPFWAALERFGVRRNRLPLWTPAAACLFLLPWAFMNWQTRSRFQLLEGGAANMNIVTGALGVVTGAHGDYQTLMGPGWDNSGSVTLWALRTVLAAPAAAARAVGQRLAYVFALRPLLFLLALAGFWRLRGSDGARRLALLAAYFIFVHCLMSVEDNYFEPLWPLLAVLAAGLVSSSKNLAAPRPILAGALAAVTVSCLMALATAGVLLRYTLLARQEPPTSPQALERALSLAPDDAWLLLQKGRSLLSQGRAAQASLDLARSAKAQPRLMAAKLEWAWAELERGDAEPLLEGAFEDGVRQEDLPLKTAVYRAAAALRLGRESRAREELALALSLWNRSRSLLHGAATEKEKAVAALLLQGADLRFASKIERLLEGKPPADLLAVLRLLTRLRPRQPELFLETARLAFRNGRPREAHAELRKAEHLPLTKDQRLALAGALRSAGDAASAQRVLGPLLKGKPSPEIWIEQAEIFMLAGRPKQAQEALGKAAGANADPGILHDLALSYQRMGKPDYAVSLLAPLSRRRPLDPKILTDLGLCRHLSGDSQGAVADLQLALRLDPRHWPAALTLGAVYAARGEQSRALEIYKAALSQPPPSYPEPAWELLRRSASMPPAIRRIEGRDQPRIKADKIDLPP
jgi:tetratricopeptide (TPR) repeat protein